MNLNNSVPERLTEVYDEVLGSIIERLSDDVKLLKFTAVLSLSVYNVIIIVSASVLLFSLLVFSIYCLIQIESVALLLSASVLAVV